VLGSFEVGGRFGTTLHATAAANTLQRTLSSSSSSSSSIPLRPHLSTSAGILTCNGPDVACMKQFGAVLSVLGATD